jgi:long-chain acyl-CoA synthetase
MITARLHRIASQAPGAMALIDRDKPMSYAELGLAVAGVRRLLEQKRVQAGDTVMLSLPPGWQAVATFFACAELGSLFLPVNPAWRQAELAWILSQAPPSVVILARGGDAPWIEAGLAPERIVFADELSPLPASESSPRRTEEWPADHPVAGVASSGSTGVPKIAIKTHGGMTGIASAMAAACGIGPGNRLLATVPCHHGHGLANNLVLPLLNGATLVLLEQFEATAVAEQIERHAVDYLIGSPTIYGVLTGRPIGDSALRSLRVCLCGGAPLAPATLRDWMRRCATPIRQAYGSSEAGMIAIESEEMPDPACVGVPIPGNEIRILSGDVEQVDGEMGEIVVRGPGVVTQYLGEAPAPATHFWQGFLRTGDLGWKDLSGRLFLAGRMRPWINAGGTKIDPVEVQRVIRQIPGVLDCTVEAEAGPGGKDIVAASIVAESGGELTRAAVMQHCRKHLAEFKIPRVIKFVAAAAADLTGKTPKPWASKR